MSRNLTVRCPILALTSLIVSLAYAAEGDRRTYVAHVSSHRSHQDALPAYAELESRAPDALEGIKPFVQQVDLASKGQWHRLRLGPLMSHEEALALCKKIRNAGHEFCEVKDAYELAQKAAGYFGELVLKPIDDGRNMTLVKPFGFVDSQARTWEAPSGSVTDGASIPRVFWSLIGSPFTGKYLKAAVIHDHFARTKHRSWSLTHDVFYEAMIAGGVDRQMAMVMWAAVYRFGPRWAENESYCAESCAGGNIILENVEIFPKYIDQEFKTIRQLIDTNPTLTKEALQEFIERETYYPPGVTKDFISTPYPAHIRGYVTGSFHDGGGDPNFKPRDWAEGPGNRRFVDGLATTRWPLYGSGGRRCADCNITYRVTRVRANDTLKVRAGPGVKHTVIAQLPHDATGITIEGPCKAIWCRIKFGSLQGFADTSFLQGFFVRNN